MKDAIIKGRLTEMRFVIRATEHGWRVSQPIFRDGRYDFIIEKNDRLLRVQVKTAIKDKRCNSEFIRTQWDCKRAEDGGRKWRSYDGYVDFFVAYSVISDEFAILPVAVIKDRFSIRFSRRGFIGRYIGNWDFKEVV